ncbi:hypothetical protein P885DRAFT_77583 [Corynascus similis CBS 632.67]
MFVVAPSVVVVVEAEVEATAPSGLNLAGRPASSQGRCLAAATAQSNPPQQAAGLGAFFNPVQGAIRGEVLGAFFPTTTTTPVSSGDLPIVPESSYHLRRYTHGIPEGQSELLFNQALPHESNVDAMHAIDFRKGCYVG